MTYEAYASGTEIFNLMLLDNVLQLSFLPNMNGLDTLFIKGSDIYGAFSVDTVLVTVNSINDAPSEFALLAPSDSAEVLITPESIANDEIIDISWTVSEDLDGDSITYGFVLYNGGYSLEIPALYTAEIGETMLLIPHSSASALLEVAGFQSLTCDWTVYATDGLDTTMSNEVRTLFIDARPVLSIDDLLVPEVFALHQNYPNPFNPTTTINYDIPESQLVTIMIYDIMGREIKSLVNEYQELGFKSVRWDATDNFGRAVSAGMYVYTIQAGDFRQVKKMVLLK